MSRFSERMRFLQKETDITQVHLAEALNVTPGTISHWKNGTKEVGAEVIGAMDRLIGYVSKMRASRKGKLVFAVNYLRGGSRG